MIKIVNREKSLTLYLLNKRIKSAWDKRNYKKEFVQAKIKPERQTLSLENEKLTGKSFRAEDKINQLDQYLHLQDLTVNKFRLIQDLTVNKFRLIQNLTANQFGMIYRI